MWLLLCDRFFIGLLCGVAINIENTVIENCTLNEALGKLPPEDRELVMLRYINDVPVSVIAELYKISRFALNRRLNGILKDLRNEIGKEELQ